MPYIPKKKFISQDPELREKQLANLRRGNRPGTLQEIKNIKKKLQEIDVIEFATGEDWLNLSFEKRPAQAVVLKCIFGMRLTKKELRIYQKITKNRKEFEARIAKEESVLVLGARSGKSLLASVIALYESTRPVWREYLNKGEFGYAVVVSTRQKQSEQIIQANCLRLMQNSKNLKGLIKDFTMSELTLKNNMKIVSSPCTSVAYRGVPIYFLACDEIGHFFTEGPKSDKDILDALIPRMSQFPKAKLMLISTPSAKQGKLWEYYDEGFKKSGRLTAQAETLLMNPLVDRNFLKKERARDPDLYSREYLARFCEKVEAYLSSNLIESSLKLAGDLAYKEGYQYFSGIDASGLAGRDKFSMAITHKQDNNVYVDKILSWDLRDPDPIMKDIKELAGIYHFNKTVIDKYARGWVESALRKIGLEVSTRPNLAEVYANMKSLMLGNRLYLPDNPGLKKALQNTQAYFGRNNALSIAHERIDNSHSDEADAIATAIFKITGEGEDSTSKLLDDMSENVKADMRMGRSERPSSRYSREMESETGEDWGGPGRSRPGGDW